MNSRRLVLLLLLPLGLLGQSNSVSPYSRFGLGDRVTTSFMQGFTMGQLSTALRDPYNINLNNPAAANALALTTLEMAGKVVTVNQSSNNAPTVGQTYGSFNYFALGIPVSERYGLSFGALPFSAVGYRLSEVENLDDIGRVTRQYQGTGGINKLYLNQSFRILKGLNIGAQVAYYFGNIEYLQDVRYADASFLSSRYDQEYNISDVNWNFGVQYVLPLNEEKNELILGAAWESQNTLSGTFNQSAFTYTAVGSRAFPRDTLTSLTLDDDLGLPNTFSFGISYGGKHPDVRHQPWIIGLDVQLVNWSTFYDGEDGSQPLVNSRRYSLGGEVTPRYAFRSLYRSRSTFSNWKYRIGGYAYESPIELRGERINTYGMTFGIGIPLRVRGLAPGEERNNTINIGYNYAVRGTLNQGLIREEISQFIFGVTLNDRWFIKYKYR